jgi:hypothetical protein
MARKGCDGTKLAMWFLLGFVFGQCTGPGCVARADEVAATKDAQTAPTEVRVLAAAHEGRLSDGGIQWDSTFQISHVGAYDGPTTRLPLAMPLPEGVEVLKQRSTTMAPVLDETGRVVAFDIERADLLAAERVELCVRQALEGRRGIRLAAPLAAGEAIQVVAVEGSGGAQFEPDPSTGLLQHIGYSSGGDLPFAQRRRADRLLGPVHESWGKGRVYLRSDPQLVASGGLIGDLVSTPDRTRPALVVVGVTLPLLILALLVLHARLDRPARVERAEAVLREEMGELRRRASGAGPGAADDAGATGSPRGTRSGPASATP